VRRLAAAFVGANVWQLNDLGEACLALFGRAERFQALTATRTPHAARCSSFKAAALQRTRRNPAVAQ